MASPDEQSRLLNELRLSREQREPPARGARRRWLLGAAVIVLLSAAGGFAWLRSQRIEVQAAVASAPARSGGPGAVLQATGYVTARRQATVSAQITGTLSQVLIEEGEHVEAGQVLARLEDSSQRAALAQARATQQAASALQAQFEAQLAQARRDLKRNQDLIDRNLVSRQSLEDAQTEVDSLAAQLGSQRQQIELAQAGVQAAQVQLDYTVVRAPFAGVVIAKAAQAGEIISPISAGGGFTRTGVGTLVDMGSLEIEVDVNEAYINRVLPAQRAESVLDAYPDWKIPSHVIAIVPTADRSKATVKVRVGIDQKDPRILPDMGVRVSFLEDAATPSATAVADSVLVPSAAVVDRQGRTLVFVIDGERVHARAVTAAAADGDLRPVTGVAAGTRVVRVPPEDLRDGARVVVTP